MCFVKGEMYCISSEEFNVQSDDHGAHHVICNGDFSLLRIKSRDVTP